MARIKIKVVRLPHAQGLELPGYQTAGAAGMDLLAAVGEGRPLTIAPGKWALVPTGLILELPKGVEAQVRPRSGLALKHGVTVLNAPGTIDSDYRGELGVLLVNLGTSKFKIERGMRIAQMVVQKVEQVSLVEATSATATARGAGGFGSTGVQNAAAKKTRKPIKKVPTKATGKPSKQAPHKPAARTLSRQRKAAGQIPLVSANPQNQRRLNAHRKRPVSLRTRVSPRSP